MSVIQRVIKGIGANAFGQAVTLAIQLFSAPILISVWGVDKYGEWLVISAIPAYLTLSDLGLTTASANKITMLYEKKRIKTCVVLYQTCFWMVSITCTLIILLVLSFGSIVNLSELFGLSIFSKENFLILSGVLFFHVLLSIQTSVLGICYRCVKKNPMITLMINLIRTIEWSLALTVVINTKSAILLTSSLIFVRLIGNTMILFHARVINPHFNFTRGFISLRGLKIIIKPAISSMAFPLGLALIVQGMTVLISVVVGPYYVALFNIYRTLTRVLIQCVTVVNQSIWPEVSYAFANLNIILIQILLKKSWLLSISLVIILTTVIILFNNEIINGWLGKIIAQDEALLLLMLASAFIHVFWQRYWVFLMATNNHMKFAGYFLQISILTCLLSYLFMSAYGIYGSAISLIISELFCWVLSKRSYKIAIQQLRPI